MFCIKYIIAFSILLLGLFFFPQTIHAQTTDQIIGLQRIISPVNGYSLLTADPNTGQTNLIANFPNPNFHAIEATFDASTNQFFVQECPGGSGTICQLFTIDGSTGAVINSVTTPYVIKLHVGRNNTLIGFQRILSPVDGNRLVTIDPTNGQVTTIADYANPRFFVIEAEYDQNSNQVFVQDCPGGFGVPCQLLTIDAATGTIVASVSSPHISGLHMNGTNSLIGLQRILSPVNGYSLNTVDPTNGQITTIANYANPNFFPSEVAVSQTNQLLYVQECLGGFGVPCTLYSILTTTGGIVRTVSTPHIFSPGIMPINITNTPPSIDTITVLPNPVEVNTPVIATASFTDADITDTHIATVSWGDSSSPTACNVSESNGSGTATCDRPSGYAAPGVYSPVITVTDNHAASGDSPPYEYLSVYNPTNQGLFSGASKFTTPAGSYPVNGVLSGQVKFGVTAKYDNNNQATGNVSMNFKDADLEFESTSITVLVTANGKATLMGTGTVNGTGNYNFLVTGLDSTTDTIRFKITDSSNNVIYDSQPGAATTDDPTAAVTGQVIVH